jgi:Mrp family chromosome partitioning ATPase
MNLVSLPENSLSVAFEPRAANRDSLMPPPNFSRHPIASRVLARFTDLLKELGRRARRVGPVDRGTVVLLAGCHEKVGVSTMALSCAAAAASEQPAALVDADLSNRGLTHLLVERPAAGWDDVVSGAGSMEQAVHYVDARERFAFFPLRSAAVDFSVLRGHSGLTGWLSRLREEYPLVFLDGGSMESGAVHWAPWVDAVLIVCDPARSADSDRTRAWDRFEESGAHVLGIVETFV